MKAEIIYQPLGNSWAVGIESDDPKEIESQDFSWYNHGAYNGELKYMSPRFAYIWTTEEDFKSYLYKSSMAKLLSKYGNSLKGKVRRYARLLARIRLNMMKHETFVSVSHNGTAHRLAIPADTEGEKTMKNGGYFNDEEEWKQNVVCYYNFQ